MFLEIKNINCENITAIHYLISLRMKMIKLLNWQGKNAINMTSIFDKNRDV